MEILRSITRPGGSISLPPYPPLPWVFYTSPAFLKPSFPIRADLARIRSLPATCRVMGQKMLMDPSPNNWGTHLIYEIRPIQLYLPNRECCRYFHVFDVRRVFYRLHRTLFRCKRLEILFSSNKSAA